MFFALTKLISKCRLGITPLGLFTILVWSGLSADAQQAADSTLQYRHLEEVVVTAQYQPQSLRQSVYKMQVINQKKIQARAAANIQQILSGELGIWFSNDMALGTANITLMGMSGRNIKILLDGVPLLDRGDIRESLNQINAAQVERIEMVEGPMSTVYGSDALAGVINIITKKNKNGAIQLQAQLIEESAGTEYNPIRNKGLHTQQLSAGWDKGSWSALVSMLHYDFGGFGADSIGRAHSWKPKEQWLPSVRLGYRKDRWDVTYRNDYLLEQIVGKGAINTNVYKAVTQTFTTARMAQQAQFNYRWSPKLYLNSSLSYTDYKRYTKTELIDYNTRTISLTEGAGEQDTAQFKALNVRATLVYNINRKLSMQPGVEYNRDAASGDRIVGTPLIHNYAVFLSGEYKPTEYINIRPGLRTNINSIYKAPPVLPSLNTLFRLNNKLALRLAYAQGFRAPSLRELYFEFKDANHNITGNEQLKAEHSYSINGALSYRKPLNQHNIYATELGFFFNRFNNMIDLAVNPENSQENIYVNIAQNRTAGLSLSNRYITRNVEWKLGGLLLGQYNELYDVAPVEDPVPRFSWSPEVNVELMYQIPATQTKINVFYKYTGPRKGYNAETDASGAIKLSLGTRQAYHIADLNVQQKLTKVLNLTAGVRNLFNVSTLQNSISSGSVHTSGGNIPLSYGRSYFVSLNVNVYNKLK